MRTHPHRTARTLALLLMTLALTTGCSDGCKSSQLPSSSTAAAKAKAAKREAIAPRLEKVATAHPPLAPDVRDVVDHWDSRPERETYNLSIPLLDTYKADHPADAAATDQQLQSWKRRLDTFND